MPTSVGKQLKQFNLFYAAHISLLCLVIFIIHTCHSVICVIRSYRNMHASLVFHLSAKLLYGYVLV